MKKLLAIGAFFTAAWCSAVSAQWVSTGVNPKSVGTIHVYLEDGAIGGYWTNLREVREYAEEKLRIAGYSTTSDDIVFGQRLSIKVTAYKSNGQCVGSARAALVKPSYLAGFFGFYETGHHTILTNQNRNLNTEVISVVQELINEM